MANIYGQKKCPQCQKVNYLYRPLENILPAWDEVTCWGCGFEYLHSDILKKVGK